MKIDIDMLLELILSVIYFVNSFLLHIHNAEEYFLI